MTDRGRFTQRARPPAVDWTQVEQAGPRSWQDDLWDLLNAPDEDPVQDILQSAPGQMALDALGSRVAQGTFAALDAPSRVLIREPIGRAINLVQGEGLGGSGQEQWDEAITGLREADMGPLGILKTPIELGINLLADPLTYTGIGPVAKGVRALSPVLKGAEKLSKVAEVERLAGRPLMAGVAKGGEMGLRGLQAYNDAPGRFLLPPAQKGVTKVREGIQRIKPTLFDPEPAATDTILGDTLEVADLEKKSTAPKDPLTPNAPNIKPITETPFAPVPPHPHPPGSAPSLVYARADGAWARLWSRFTGKNVPLGILPGTETSPLYTGRGKSGFRDESITRYESPYEASMALDDPMLNDMATVGVAIMQNITDAGGLFPSLQRASTGSRLVREALVERHGRGVEPLLPTIHARMREQLGDQADAMMPASRYLLPWGWAEETVGTNRLTAANKRIAKAIAKPDKKQKARIAEIGKDAYAAELRNAELGTMASSIPQKPEVVEAAASQGTAMLTMFRSSPDTMFKEFTEGGAYFPQTIPGQPNQYAGVPSDFVRDLWQQEGAPGILQFDLSEAGKLWGVTQPFGSTREAWDSYVQHAVGELAPDELETLASISADQLYNTYVNVANPVSGGPGGARKIAEAFAKSGALLPEDFKSGYNQKIGAYPGAPEDIGSEQSQARIRQLESLGEAGPLGGKFNKNTGKLHVGPLVEAGINPENPTGGFMPNLEQLQEFHKVGAELPISASGNLAKDWYANGAREIEAVVGLGNYEDALMLLNANAITSAATDVKTNGLRALRVLSEWKFKIDKTTRDHFGIEGPELSNAINQSLLEPDLMKSQKKLARKLFDQFIAFREDPGLMRSNLQGGPKTHNFAGSFLVNIWRDQMDLAIKNAPDNEVLKQARQDFEDALTIYTVDRHAARVDNLGNAVTDLEAYLLRERGILGAKAAGVSGEEFQSGLWYWVRDQQGFTRQLFGDSDVATVLRGVVERTWDEGQLPVHEFQSLVSRFTDEWGFDERGSIEAIYEEIQQDLVYRLMQKSFNEAERVGRRDWAKAGRKAGGYDPARWNPLAKAGFPTSLEEFQADTMGIIQRGAHGLAPREWKQPLGAMEVNTLHEAYNAGLADATAGRAVVLGFDGQRWAPVADPSSAVPIRTGGVFDPTRNIGARKALERLITNAEIADAFDPVVQYGAEAHLGIGILPGGAPGEDARAALFLLDAPPSGITPPEGASLASILDGVAGPKEARPRFGAETLRRRKATLAELDVVNPWSIFQRKVVRPIMARYTQDSLKEGTEKLTAKGLGDLSDIDFPEQAAGAFESRLGTSPHFNPSLSVNSQRAYAQEFSNGETYGEVLLKESRDAAKDLEAFQRSGVTYKLGLSVPERIKAAEGNPEAQKIIRKWGDEKRDPMAVNDPDAVARDRVVKRRAKEQGREYAKPGKYDLFRGAWSELALASVRYLTGNAVSDMLMVAISGTKPTYGLQDFRKALLAVRSGSDVITRSEVMSSLKANQIMQSWGLEAVPQRWMRGGVKDVTVSGGRYSTTNLGEIAGRITRSPELARKVEAPIKFINEIATAQGGIMRMTKGSDVFDRKMREYMLAFDGEVNRRGANIPGFEFSITQNINMPPEGLYYESLLDHLEGMGLAHGQAKNLAQVYVNIRNKALKEADTEIDKVLFSYEKTNLDKYFGKVAPFTYWYSRALRFWWEEALSHPALLTNYMKMTDGIEDAQNDPGLSARQKGFIKVFGTALGFSLLMNPDALFGVVKAFNMNDDYTPEGETAMGGVLSWMKKAGMGLYPWIDGTFNLMGTYGNDFEPDLLGIRHKALVGSVVNYVAAHAGFSPVGAPYADAMGQVRYATSSFVSSFTPDWLSQPVTPKPGNSAQEASLDTIIENIVITNNPNLTQEQLLGIMVDPEGEEYNRAYQQASAAGLITQTLNFILPFQSTMRNDARDVRTAQVAEIKKAAEARGVAPFRFTPTPGDLAFAARYKAQTGKDWKPTDYVDAKGKLDLARAPVEAKPFLVAEQAFNQLGGPNRAVYDQYQAIRNGTDPITQNEPDPVMREEMAQRWLDAHPRNRGAIDQVDLMRQGYRADHPEFDQFKQWQSQMYQLSTQYGGSLAEYRRRAVVMSPNFARYWARTELYIQQTFPQDQWDAKYEEYTKNAAAFQAIHGIAEYRSTQGPVPGAPVTDVTLPSFPAEGGYGPAKPDWVQTLQQMGQGTSRDVLQ